MKIFKNLLFLLTPQELKSAGLLLIMIIIMALLDVIGVASILPFMAVLTNPNLIETNLILNSFFKSLSIFGVENNNQFLFALGVIVFVLLVISLVFKSITIYLQAYFSKMCEYSISKRLIEKYLHQPYSWSLNRHSSELGTTILSEVNRVIGSGLSPMIEVISRLLVTIGLVILIIVANPKLALIISVSLGVAYGLIFYFVRKYLAKIGKQTQKNNQLRFLSVNDAFSAIKEIKTGGLEQIFIKQFSKPAKTFAKNETIIQAISQIPRYILEIVAFGGILLMLLYMISQTNDLSKVLPIITLYVFAGYRLMPSVQQIYHSFTNIVFIGPSLEKLCNDLKNLKLIDNNQNKEKLLFEKKISLKKIYYNYPNASQTSLSNINLTIPAKSTVGIIGTTGSGKTTMIDIILGLLEPQKGTLEIDDKIITKKNMRSWQRSIGYVPQNIYLIDDTIAANIAFGVEAGTINQKLVENAAKTANLHEFVINELPEKYETTIGERGVRLSGGQRQRIGLARALYHKPQVVIMDEATSALDYQTEEIVMDAIKLLGKNTTIILIAHRLNTLKHCNIIYKLDKGELVDQGTFDELINNK
ncbi:ABC transporter ATP-binding protein/permease [Candidatus Pelagibacter sp.]|nr:ABC transporter ATP-binding protein/permease [Candidatus Pelagibacter sp.]